MSWSRVGIILLMADGDFIVCKVIAKTSKTVLVYP